MGADAEIKNLLARIAQTADTGTLEEYIANFTDDAVWEMPDNPLIGIPGSARKGHEEILSGVRERRGAGHQGPGSNTRHMLTTMTVTVESDDRATARSYFLYFGETATAPTLLTMGQYDDVFRRGDAGWQLAHRIITMG